MRFPLVRRSTMEAALDARLGRYNGLVGERDREIVRLKAELARLREHFDATVKAKDEAYAIVAGDRDAYRDEMFLHADRLLSLGILTPGDWAWPTSPLTSVAIAADINGITGGPAPCPTSPPSPTE